MCSLGFICQVGEGALRRWSGRYLPGHQVDIYLTIRYIPDHQVDDQSYILAQDVGNLAVLRGWMQHTRDLCMVVDGMGPNTILMVIFIIPLYTLNFEI